MNDRPGGAEMTHLPHALISLILATSSTANAQTFTRDANWHLAPQAGTYTENGIGSPTVVFREKHSDYVMFFESRIANADTNCSVGTWGISWATSPDGFNWTVAPTQQFPNTAGTYYECVAAHPYAVMDDNGDDIHLWFKGEQGTAACDAGVKAWGCQQYTGVGYAKFDQNLNFVLASPSPVLLETLKFGIPAVVRKDDTWYMMVARYPSFYLATSTAPDSGWSLANGGAPVMQPGVTTWAQDELFNPAMVCDDRPDFPFTTWFGVRNYATTWPVIDAGGWGNAISNDSLFWFLGSVSAFSWTGNEKWRHWDAIKAGEDTLVWFSEKQNGINHVGFASTTPNWNKADLQTRLCPATDRWGLVSPSADFVQAADWYRDYIQDFADNATTSTCASDIVNNSIQPLVTEELLFEFIKGHPDHWTLQGFDPIFGYLDLIESTCGDNMDSLRAQLAALAIHGLSGLADRNALIAGDAEANIVLARADLSDANIAFDQGDYAGAIAYTNLGMLALQDGVDYLANFCDGTEVEVYAVMTCAIVELRDQTQALYDATGDANARRARDKMNDAVEKAAMAGMKDVAKKFREAGSKLQSVGTPEATDLVQAMAEYSEIYVRQFIDDCAVSGHANANIVDAEAFYADGVFYLSQSNYYGALQAFEDAAAEAKG